MRFLRFGLKPTKVNYLPRVTISSARDNFINYALARVLLILFKMALQRYFKSKEDSRSNLLPSHAQLELTQVTNVVKKMMEELGSSGSGKQRFQYNEYSVKERAQIVKYAAENGPTTASRHFPKVLGRSACVHVYVCVGVINIANWRYKKIANCCFSSISPNKYYSSQRFILYDRYSERTISPTTISLLMPTYTISILLSI